MELYLPLIWKKAEDGVHLGHLTDDIVFRVEKSGKTWLLYVPYDVVKKNPLTAKDTDQAVDAANNIAIDHFQAIIKKHLAILQVDLFSPDSIALRKEYEAMLNLSREKLIEIFLSVDRKQSR